MTSFRLHLRILLLLLAVHASGTASLEARPHARPLHRWVDPRIGSVGEGRTFVGPCAPFGMAKPGPDAVGMPNAGWAPMPDAIKGFSQTHVSGTGGGQKYGNVLIQPLRAGDKPATGWLLLPDGRRVAVPVYAARRREESVSTGYYSCRYTNGVETEVTASERCALYRFSGAEALLVDVASFLGMDTIAGKREAQQYVSSHVMQSGDREVTGSTTVRGGWNNGGPYTVYFCLQSSVPFARVEQGGPTAAPTGSQPLTHVIAHWPRAQEVEVKVGISYVSVEQARHNITPHGFDRQLTTLRSQWDSVLARVPYQGNEREMRMFYTALYHTLLMPVDKTGENPRWHDGPYYDDFYALWDTYRTSFPLLMDYYPERATAMVNALLAIYRHEGYLPDARSGDCNGRTQGGSHAEVVIADAFARGLKGIDYEVALQAMLKDAEVAPADHEKEGRGGLAEYRRLGYIPYGVPRAGTRTVEYSYDDWCIAQVARGLGRDDLYEKYMARSRSWRNLWRADYEWQGMRGFIMPRDAAGHWLDSVPWGRSAAGTHLIAYRPDTKVAPWYLPWWDTFFYEALSAEYSLSIPHDVPGLIALCGGDSAFRRRLDTFFEQGHYNVANEPSFLTPYLYHYIGRPDLSARRVAQIVSAHFSDQPDGLPGNDDSGAMSAWLIWAMLGKYPTAPPRPSQKGEEGPCGAYYLTFDPVRLADAAPPAAAEGEASPSVPAAPHGAAPALGDEADGEAVAVHFTLNRQYRTWPLRVWMQEGELRMSCNGTRYHISRQVLDRATRFAWDRPTGHREDYRCTGTFLSISRAAYRELESRRRMVYDGLTWRELDRTDSLIHVRSDLDGSEMWVVRRPDLPLVWRMQGNKLGIDWWMEAPRQSSPKGEAQGGGGANASFSHLPDIPLMPR